MKKIYQIGLTAMLIAMLPSGLLFAGNGDGDGKGTKNTIQVKNGTGSRTITLMVNTTGLIISEDITISTEMEGVNIKDINPVVGGFEVTIDLDPDVVSNVGIGNDDIIIEIVGVDNITGVTASDANTGTSIHTNVVITDLGDNYQGTSNGGQNNGTGMQGNSNDATVIHPTVSGTRSDVSIYPNPVTDQTNVVTVGEILGKTIQIMDLSGHVVMNINMTKNSRQTVINIGHLTPGLYILNIELEDGSVISKRLQKV